MMDARAKRFGIDIIQGPLGHLSYDKRTLFESDTMKPKKPNAEQQHQLDLELVKTKPANRTEAKAHLAAQLRISKHKTQTSSKIRVNNFRGRKKVDFSKAEEDARKAMAKANATRFSEGEVESVETDRISESNKRWRGKTAD